MKYTVNIAHGARYFVTVRNVPLATAYGVTISQSDNIKECTLCEVF